MAATKTTTKQSANGTASKAETTAKNERLAVLKTYKIYINGQFPRTESGRYYTIKLSNKEQVNVCLSSRKDFRNSVSAAREAQEKWAGKTAYNRSQILYRIAEMLETRRAQFTEELVNQGASAAAAKEEISIAVDRLIYYAGWCDKFNQVFSSVNPVSSSHFNFSSLEPTGVVAAIADQNSRLLGLISIIAPVIASGNTIIALASTQFPLSAITFAEVLNTSDLPAGVVNILIGEVSELLVPFTTHMDVNAVYFNTNNQQDKVTAETNAALNVKRVKVEASIDWTLPQNEDPYRILDYTEVKTTWHPIGI
jgi:acyl-CoA reductase-like NAD-dependent aldehyde dehydrogenase